MNSSILQNNNLARFLLNAPLRISIMKFLSDLALTANFTANPSNFAEQSNQFNGERGKKVSTITIVLLTLELRRMRRFVLGWGTELADDKQSRGGTIIFQKRWELY